MTAEPLPTNPAHAALEALGDPMRRLLVEQLSHGALSVGRLAEPLPIGRPAVSRHLRILERAGLVSHVVVGTRSVYALVPGGLYAVQRWLSQQWQGAVAAAETVDEPHDEPAA